jgi:hypothetical protein
LLLRQAAAGHTAASTRLHDLQLGAADAPDLDPEPEKTDNKFDLDR